MRETEVTAIVKPGAAELELVAAALRSGELAVIPTDTVYGLAALPKTDSVSRLYVAKGRPEDKPIPVLLESLDAVKKVAKEWPETANILAQRFWPGPLTIIVPALPDLPATVTAGLNTVGLRVPAHAACRELIRLAGGYLAVTSANRSGEPPALTAAQALEALSGYVRYVIDDGPAPGGVPSTIVTASKNSVSVIRRGAVPSSALQEALTALLPKLHLVGFEE